MTFRYNSNFTDTLDNTPPAPSPSSFTKFTITAASVNSDWGNIPINANSPNPVLFDKNLVELQIDNIPGIGTLYLPDATKVTNGQTLLFVIDPASSGTGPKLFLVGFDNGLLVAIAKLNSPALIILVDASTPTGVWVGYSLTSLTAVNNAYMLIGKGLAALNNKLNQTITVVNTNINYQITAADRGKLIVWSGGDGQIVLPVSGDVANGFYVGVCNNSQISGIIRIRSLDNKLINDQAYLDLLPSDSAYFDTDLFKWYTIGYGTETYFNPSFVEVTVTGGAVSLTEPQSLTFIIRFIGVLTSDALITVPSTPGQWYFSNFTTGDFFLSITTVSGNSVIIDQNQSQIVMCDGINVYRSPSNTGSANIYATYVTQVPNVTLLLEYVLEGKGSGALKNTTATGELSVVTPADANYFLGSNGSVVDYIPIPPTFLLETPDAIAPNGFDLSALGTGLLINQTGTGDLTTLNSTNPAEYLQSNGTAVSFGTLSPTFLLQVPDASSPSGYDLSALGTGLFNITNGTGISSIMPYGSTPNTILTSLGATNAFLIPDCQTYVANFNVSVPDPLEPIFSGQFYTFSFSLPSYFLTLLTTGDSTFPSGTLLLKMPLLLDIASSLSTGVSTITLDLAGVVASPEVVSIKIVTNGFAQIPFTEISSLLSNLVNPGNTVLIFRISYINPNPATRLQITSVGQASLTYIRGGILS